MSKKALPLVLLWVLLLSLCSQSVSAPVTIPNQEHLIMETVDEPASLDPAWAIDTASRALIFNVYDTLVFFDQENLDEFLPYLATDWLINQPPHPFAPAGTNSTWYFTIRTGVRFQDGSTLTPEDVEYSFERLMVMDRTGGPAWKIYGPLLGVYLADMDWPEDPTCPINLAVQCNSTHVWFNLAMPFPSLPFMQILCGSWASIVNEDFCVAQGCWPSHDWMHWKDYHDPEISPLDAAGDIMMGTGPYMFDYWDHGAAYSIVAFNKNITWPSGYDPAGPDPPHTYEYWQGWPAPHCSRYLDRITNKIVYETGIRLYDFYVCVADEVYVPTAYLPQMILNWPTTWDPDARMRLDAEGNPEYYATGIECLPGLPTLYLEAMFFTLHVNPASPYVGNGQFPNGIPLVFFSDERIRKAFAYCFDYDTFLEDVYWNEAVQPASCIPEGKPYHNPDNPKYNLNLTKARELFMAASADPTSPAYQVWDLGFNMTITYNMGPLPRAIAAVMLETSVENLFELGPDGIPGTGDEAPGTAVISVLGLTGPTFESELHARYMPLFITGWLNEFVDPHDDVHPFMHTLGHFSRFQRVLGDATVDALIELGITTPDGPARQAIYYTLQLIYYQDCLSVCLAQPYKRHWERDWVQGWYYNPLYPGNYYYHLWKGLDGDINVVGSANDGKVDMLDLGVISAHWYPGPPEGPEGYGVIADICPELQYVLSEDPYEAIPKVWDSETETWIPHPSIRAVDIYDAGLVSAHWLEQINPI